MRTAIYLRVSTVEQAESGYGLADQRTKCYAMAAVKGWEVITEYMDEGISGTLDASGRPGLALMLQAVCNGELDAVIVAALDRLGRSTRIVLDIVENLVECKAEIVSCKESIDTSTPAGRFVLTVFAALAELDRDSLTARMTGGRNERGKKDGERGGRLPLGYVRGEAGIEVDQMAALTVKRIFALRKNGYTLTAIADELNQGGNTTRHGVKWYASSVRQVLLNEKKYKGGNRGASQEHWLAILEAGK